MSKKITTVQAQKIGNSLGVDWTKVPVKELAMGISVELEHKVLTGGDLEKTAMIALDHLEEDTHYYSKLKVMEAGFKKEPKRRKKGRRP